MVIPIKFPKHFEKVKLDSLIYIWYIQIVREC